MNIIIDECVPSVVKLGLPDLHIKTVQEMGWAGIKNGELLILVAGFDIFITSDKNLQYQQNLANFQIAVILLPGNQVPLIESLLSRIDDALTTIQPNEFVAL